MAIPPHAADYLADQESKRKARREELARDLLLKLVETTGGRGQYDIQYNTRAAVEYTDALVAELEKVK